MRRNTLNFIIDLVTLLVMLAMVSTGLWIRYALPPGSGGRGGGQGLELWGLGRHDWGDIHFWLAVALAGLLVVHVALHWKWVCGTIRLLLRPDVELAGKRSSWTPHLWGLGFLIVTVLLVGGIIWFGQANVITAPTGTDDDHAPDWGRREEIDSPAAAERDLSTGRRGHGNQRFHGSMTLEEAAKETGASIDRLRELLSLPSDTPANERLGRQQGIDMHNVRLILEQYRSDSVHRQPDVAATRPEVQPTVHEAE